VPRMHQALDVTLFRRHSIQKHWFLGKGGEQLNRYLES